MIHGDTKSVSEDDNPLVVAPRQIRTMARNGSDPASNTDGGPPWIVTDGECTTRA